ncbi:hypothetical protein CLV31_11417 [Algoriphagus aquaeductus]|uniref:Uncharacterized protein n=1 Tax=Algoriphagus aquaeductus TaxID=475299 RepID=A0A326RPF9_9BACT|nr:hypothetical protein [Algoriphagus aquaeductus]PZV79585.1 hypothetical protein CLV31_11417 [Algoriphagus aquaeductus]
MKVINPVLRKVLVELKGLDSPLEFWWDDKMILGFDKILMNSNDVVIRAPNTPTSLVEFRLEKFKSYHITEMTEILLKEQSFVLTNFNKYYQSLRIPTPRESFNDEFDFPLTLICLLNNNLSLPVSIDFSNYLNLDYLKNRNLTIEEAFFDQEEKSSKSQLETKILFAEYISI